jgi:hypothetical protein
LWHAPRCEVQTLARTLYRSFTFLFYPIFYVNLWARDVSSHESCTLSLAARPHRASAWHAPGALDRGKSSFAAALLSIRLVLRWLFPRAPKVMAQWLPAATPLFNLQSFICSTVARHMHPASHINTRGATSAVICWPHPVSGLLPVCYMHAAVQVYVRA